MGYMGSYERFRDWWEEALDDYEAAELLAKFGKYSKTFFLAQQASEKAVKALTIKKAKTYTGSTVLQSF